MRESIRSYLEKKGIKRKNDRENFYFCPFHSEKAPSFSVYNGKDGKERFKCFGCGKSGDIYDLMKLFGETEQIINDSLKREMPLFPYSRTEKDTQTKESSREVYKYFLLLLTLTDAGRSYLNNRGLKDSTIESFPVYSIDSSKIVSDKMKKEFKSEELLSSGLFKETEKGRTAFIWKRPTIIFPHIKNGEPVYFSNRFIDNREPRFKNLKEKSSELWKHGNSSIIYLFESIIDALSFYQIFNKPDSITIAALLSTSNGKRFVEQIKRENSSCKIVLCLDRDSGGISETKSLSKSFSGIEQFNYSQFFEKYPQITGTDWNNFLKSLRQVDV